MTLRPGALSSHSPLRVQGRLFYGWIVVASTFTTLCVAYGMQFSFGVFMPAMATETGWDRASLSAPFSLYVLVYSALSIVTGRWTDRWGPRPIITCGGCLLGIGIILTSQAQTLWQLYLFFGLIAAAGMSATFVPCNATVVRWFVRQRGLALGLASSGSSFGNFLFPPVVTLLITAYGWRTTYLLLGCLAVIVISICAFFVVRDPSQMALLPDGDLAEKHQPATAGSLRTLEAAEEWTLTDARRTQTFWLLNGIFTLCWLVIFMPLVHIVPFAVDIGLSPGQAAFCLSLVGLAGFTGRLVIGPISDRLGCVPALGLCLSLQTLAFVGFVYSAGAVSLYPTAMIFGFSYGGTTMLFPALVGNFFGRLSVGAIMGFIFSIAGSAAAFGPLLAGYIHRVTGQYTVAFALSAGLNLMALGLTVLLKKPVRAILKYDYR